LLLDFDNRPLREFIATGRNKGLSIILATQNMDSYKSEHFDFYANAQYPSGNLLLKSAGSKDKSAVSILIFRFSKFFINYFQRL